MAKFTREQLRNPRIFSRDELIRNIHDRNQRFDALSPVEKRIAIAKDVLMQIRDEKMLAESGTYLALDDESLAPADWSQEVLDNLPSCNVCAIGSAFVSCAQLFNKVEGIHDGGFNSNYMKDYLATFFSTKQLELLEAAFESDMGFIQSDTISIDEADRALEFGQDYEDDTERLTAIWENVLENYGTFKP